MSKNPPALTIGAAPVTMTSLELVDFINAQRGESDLTHANFLAKVPKVLGEESHSFECDLPDGYGRSRRAYRFPKREACLMAMSYSYELQAKVFDRMTELEGGVSVQVPRTMAQALRLAAEQAEALEVAHEQLALAAPKVDFHDRYAVSTGNKGVREVAKLLQANERHFIAWLTREDGPMYRLAGSLTPKAPQLDSGRFEVKAGTAEHGDNSHAYNQAKFTPKGVTWVAGEWAKHQLAQRRTD